MNLKKVLSPQTVRVGLRGTNKKEIIEEMVDLIVSSTPGLDKAALLQAVMDREAQMSTGMSNGIAIPHGKTDVLSSLYAAMAVSMEAVDFQSLDKQPAQIFAMTVSPPSASGDHLQFLAEVSRILSDEDTRQHILRAKTDAELLKILVNGSS